MNRIEELRTELALLKKQSKGIVAAYRQYEAEVDRLEEEMHTLWHEEYMKKMIAHHILRGNHQWPFAVAYVEQGSEFEKDGIEYVHVREIDGGLGSRLETKYVGERIDMKDV